MTILAALALSATCGLPTAGDTAAPAKPPAPKPDVAPRAAATATDFAVVKFVDLMHGTRAVRVFVNEKEDCSLGFGEVSKARHPAPGSDHLVIKEAESTLLDTKVDLLKDHKYVIALRGRDKDAHAEVLQAHFATDKACLRVFNLGKDVGSFDLIVDGTPVARGSGIAFGKDVAAELAPGKHSIELRSGKDPLLTQQENLAADTCTFAFLAGDKVAGVPPKLVLVREISAKT